MALNIQVGYTTEDPRKLDKRTNFNSSSPTPFTATIKENCSVMSPDFIVSTSLVNLANSNYVHCDEWDRYYFIDDLVTMPGGRVAIRCREDVLTSNADQIRTLSGYLIRTADDIHTNKLIRDNVYPAQSNRQMQIYQFDASPFTANYASDIVYVLTVVGGDHSVANP